MVLILAFYSLLASLSLYHQPQERMGNSNAAWHQRNTRWHVLVPVGQILCRWLQLLYMKHYNWNTKTSTSCFEHNLQHYIHIGDWAGTHVEQHRARNNCEVIQKNNRKPPCHSNHFKINFAIPTPVATSYSLDVSLQAPKKLLLSDWLWANHHHCF